LARSKGNNTSSVVLYMQKYHQTNHSSHSGVRSHAANPHIGARESQPSLPRHVCLDAVVLHLEDDIKQIVASSHATPGSDLDRTCGCSSVAGMVCLPGFCMQSPLRGTHVEGITPTRIPAVELPSTSHLPCHCSRMPGRR
jgi:hypothetical protein